MNRQQSSANSIDGTSSRASLLVGVLLAAGLTLLALASLAQAAPEPQPVDFFGGPGVRGGQFQPIIFGIAVNQTGAGAGNAGDIYVSDNFNNRIERFARNDNGTPADGSDDTYSFISAWGAGVEPTAGQGYEVCNDGEACREGTASGIAGGLNNPAGLAIDEDTGDLYVADTGNARVDAYSGDGEFIRTFGVNVVKSGPDDAGSGYEVCVPANGDVCQAGTIGSGIGQMGGPVTLGHEDRMGIAVSQPDGNASTGSVFLADRVNDRVNTYNLNGSNPGSIGSASVFSGEYPRSVAVDSRGILYADTRSTKNHGEIERYDTEGVDGSVGFIAPIPTGTNEVQQLNIDAKAGSFHLTYHGESTPDLPFDIPPGSGGGDPTGTLEAALRALPAIGGPDKGGANVIQVTGGFQGQPYEIEFIGRNGVQDVEQIEVADGATPLSGGSGASITTLKQGKSGLYPEQATRSGLTVIPDRDGPGPETDRLVVGSSAHITTGVIQSFGPLNPPGALVPPEASDALQASAFGTYGGQSGVAVDEATGRYYVLAGRADTGFSAFDLNQGLGVGVYVLGTPGGPPSATLDSVSSVTATSVVAHATITPNGTPPLNYHLEYSTNGTNWSSGPTVTLGTQESPQSISEALEPPGGLAPGTFYHLRLVAKRPFFPTITTTELTFTTLVAPPIVETLGSPVRSTTTARLDSRVDPNGTSTTYHFEYGTAGPCDSNPCTATVPHRVGDSDEVQRITIEAASGQFKLTFGADTSPNLAFNASSAQVQSALEGLPSIGAGNVSVSGGPGDASGSHPYVVDFLGSLAGTDVPQISVANGTAPLAGKVGAEVSTKVPGGPSVKEVQEVTITAAEGQFNLTFGADTTPDLAFNASAAEVASALQALPSIGAGDALVSGGPGSPTGKTPYVVEFSGALANKNVSQLEAANGAAPLKGETSAVTTTTTPGGVPAVEFELASQQLEHLQPNTTYHYRVVADNGNPGSPSYGRDMTVTTLASEEPLTHGRFPGPTGSDRAWELVSEADTSGNPVGRAIFVPTADSISDNGDRAVYGIAGGTPLSETGTVATRLFAERTPSGWETRKIYPTREQAVGSNWRTGGGPADLSSIVVQNNTTINTGEISIWRIFADGSPPVKLYRAPDQSNQSGEYIGAAADGTRVLASFRNTQDPAHPAQPETTNLYEIGSEPPRLVDLLPDGSVPPCGIGDEQDFFTRPSQGWMSSDGSYTFFSSRVANCGGPVRIFMRDFDTETTKLISGAPLSGPLCGSSFIRGLPGSVYFNTETRLTADDISPGSSCSGGNSDIYRYDLGNESLKCLTCLAAGYASKVSGEVHVSDDGSHVYFTASRRLLPGAPSGSGEYSLDIASGVLTYTGSAEFRIPQHAGEDEVALSHDGSVAFFRSNEARLNATGGQQNGGTFQDYRYDDEDHSLICVSCPADGSLPTGDTGTLSEGTSNGPRGQNNGRDLDAAGDTLAFATPTPLVAADQNTARAGQKSEVGTDVYEWREGRLLLVSDGLTNWPGSGEKPTVAAITPSGRDLFFVEGAELTPDALDSYARLYDARIGGGFDFPPKPKPCPLEVCQGTPQGSPAEEPPGTSTLRGAGNPPQESKPCPKGKLRKHGKCAKRHPKAKKHHRRHHRAAGQTGRAHR